jgi:hypothetical protein
MVTQNISIIQGSAIFLFMIVLYPTLWNTNKYDSGLDTPYAWVTTSVYLSGHSVVGVLTGILILFLTMTYFLAMGSHYYPQLLGSYAKSAEKTCYRKSAVDEKDGNLDLIIWVKSFLRLFFILVINALIVGTINFRYTEIIDKENVHLQQMASFGVAVFKVFWSIYGLKSILIKNRWLYFTLDEDDVDVTILTIFSSVPSFLTFLNIMNNVLIPIVIFTIFGGKCFRYAFYAQARGSYDYSLPICENNLFYTDCTNFQISESFEKPFVYQFQCTSSIIQAYSNVYVFKYCSEFAWGIAIQMYMMYVLNEEQRELVTRTLSHDGGLSSDSNSNANVDEDTPNAEPVCTIRRTMFKIMIWVYRKNLLLFYRKDMDLDEIKGKQVSGSRHSATVKLFDPEFFSSRMVSLHVIIIVFAPFVPVLAFVGVIAIVSRYFGVRVMMGRLLEEFTLSYNDSAHSRSDKDDVNQPVTISSLDNELTPDEEMMKFEVELLQVLNCAVEKFSVSLLWQNHRLIIYLSGCWYACVITDMYSIEVGFEKGIVPGIILVCFPFVLECVGFLLKKWYLPHQSSEPIGDIVTESRNESTTDIGSPMHTDPIPASNGHALDDTIHPL